VTAKLTYASQAWSGFCTASDINKLDPFLARCKHLNYCSQTTPSIAEQFDSADQSLFRTVLYNVYAQSCNDAMHRLLPPNKRLYSINWGLASRNHIRNHNLTLTCRTSYHDNCNFIAVCFLGWPIDCFYHRFYPRDAMLARVIGTATCLSVSPSVCLSVCHAPVLFKTKKASGMISSPSGSPKTLVFWRQISSPNSKGFPRTGPQTRVGRKNSAIFDFLALNVNISKTVADTAKVTISD